MRETGADMKDKYKETARALGLPATSWNAEGTATGLVGPHPAMRRGS
jgi:hypothetical protein